MRNQLKATLNFSDVGIENQTYHNHKITDNKHVDLWDDNFDDSDLEVKPELIKRLLKSKEEEDIPINSIDDLIGE